MDYLKMFRDFRSEKERERYGSYLNSDAFDKVEELLEQCVKNSTSGEVYFDPIEDHFNNNQHPKRKTKLVFEEFNRYLKKNGSSEEELVVVPEKEFYDTDIERRMAILKLLHNPIRSKEIANVLSLDQDTVNGHIKTFKEGFTFMDTDIKVNIREDKWDRYCRSNVHPVFLALNSTELNHLITYLSESRDQEIMDICETIFSQLSDYAKNVICRNVKGIGSNSILAYHDEYEMTTDDAVGFLMKGAMTGRRQKVKFKYQEEGKDDWSDLKYGYFTEKSSYAEGVVNIELEDGSEMNIREENLRIIIDKIDDYYV